MQLRGLFKDGLKAWPQEAHHSRVLERFKKQKEGLER